MTRRPIPLVALAAALGLVPAQAAVFTVGPHAGCTTPDVHDALTRAEAAPGPDVVALVAGTIPVDYPVEVDEDTVAIEGGYADCTLAARSGRTVLQGTATLASGVLEVRGPADLRLSGLVIRLGNAPADAYGGGVVFEGRGRLELADVAIVDNVAGSGGGLAVLGVRDDDDGIVTELVLGDEVLIARNRATGTTLRGDGGGIFARHARVDAAAFGLVVADNHASGWGGGIRLDSATATLASTGGDDAFLARNASDQLGGGLAASDSIVDLSTIDALRPTRIDDNRAASGAGLAFEGGELRAWELVVTRNESHSLGSEHGGALHVAGPARFVRDLAALGGAPDGAVACDSSLECNRFEANRGRTRDAASGASLAFYGPGGGAGLVLEHATIRANDAGALVSGYCVGSACASPLVVRGSVVQDNAATFALISGRAGIDVTLDLTTIARNAGVGRVVDAGGHVALTRSIVWQPGAQLVGSEGLLPGRTVSIGYAVVHPNGLPEPLPATVVAADPGFADLAAGDLRLSEDSVALDYAPSDALLAYDLSLAPRPVDLARPDAYGPVDLGAWERAPGDALFRDGFED
jgi:hypothetical protein